MAKIVITENHIREMVKETLNILFNEGFDKSLLDGITDIDNRTINMHIKSMIPNGNRVSKNSPYAPVRQLVLYFSQDGAVKHGGKITKDIVKYIMRNPAISNNVMELSKEDRAILELIYGKNRLTGKPLMQEIAWHLDEVSQILMKLNDAITDSNVKNDFFNSEAIIGSSDGKRVGLSTIMYKAFVGVGEIKKQIKKMQEIIDAPKDAFSYNTGRFIRN